MPPWYAIEPYHIKKTSAIWIPRDPSIHKFVDDGIIDSKLDMENTTAVIDGQGVTKKTKHAIASQNLFRRIVKNAESIGMKVN